jgi:hypothetical protein
MDADAVFVKTEKDIRDVINEHLEKELIIAEDFGPDTVNTGVMGPNEKKPGISITDLRNNEVGTLIF